MLITMVVGRSKAGTESPESVSSDENYIEDEEFGHRRVWNGWEIIKKQIK